jgi:hypothetical protein
VKNFILGTNVLFALLFSYTWIDNIISNNGIVTTFFQLMITFIIWGFVDLILLVLFLVMNRKEAY